MILDDRVVHFLTNTEPLYIHLAVSDSKGKPFSVRGFGVNPNAGNDLLRIYILKTQTEKVISCIKSGNAAIACLFTDGFTNESYQIKGTFIEFVAAHGEEDLKILNQYRNGSLKLFPKLYEKYPLSPALCDLVTLKIEEVFIQTPGPYAGNKYQKGRRNHDS